MCPSLPTSNQSRSRRLANENRDDHSGRLDSLFKAWPPSQASIPRFSHLSFVCKKVGIEQARGLLDPQLLSPWSKGIDKAKPGSVEEPNGFHGPSGELLQPHRRQRTNHAIRPLLDPASAVGTFPFGHQQRWISRSPAALDAVLGWMATEAALIPCAVDRQVTFRSTPRTHAGDLRPGHFPEASTCVPILLGDPWLRRMLSLHRQLLQ